MHIFVYEYTCSVGAGAKSSRSRLQAEGWAMLEAVLEDFEQIPGVAVGTLLAEDCPIPRAGAVHRRTGAEDEMTAFRRLARAADYTQVIAPECDYLLATRCLWVEEAGGRLLGPTLAAVQLAADKWALAQHLQDHGVPTPRCRLFRPGEAICLESFPLVWKPRYGAGSQATFLLRHAGDWLVCKEQAGQQGCSGDTLLQPFVSGCPASVAILVGPQKQILLPAAAQHLSADDRFHYLGGSLPLPPALADRAQHLAARAIAAVPGLKGYVGVDLVLGDAPDGSQDWVIEINPRLTTSYVGLRALARTNLAEALLRLVRGQEIPRLSWRTAKVTFQADGSVQMVD